ncbi:MAG: hypothetical protein ACK56W_02405 [Pirellula sp.]|jgi:hypothetical protein|nr:hypothetical protein [Pirellula sp.]
MASSGKFESLALLLATGSSTKNAAQQLGVASRTAYRIASSDKMKNRVSELRSQITNEAVGRLTQGATKAADTLVELLGEANEPSTRLNASKAILASLSAISELGELRARIDALESKQCQVS